MAPDGSRGGKMGDGSLASYVERIMLAKDYGAWFSSRLSQKYIGSFPLRYNLAVCNEQRQDVAGEASSMLSLYSLLVYYIYPNSKEMQKKIGASKELSENFGQVKQWLDANGGKKAADEFLTGMQERAGQVVK